MRYLRYLRPPRLPGGRSCRRAGAALAAAVLAALALAITGSGAALASPRAAAAMRTAAGSLLPAASAATTPGSCAATVGGAAGATWMSDLAPCLGDRKLGQIVIPGTHDSATYGLPPGDVYAITQDRDLPGQLNHGMREFDIRVKYTNGNNGKDFYARHTDEISTWLTLSRIFSDIEAWAQAGHAKEIIMLNLTIDRDGTTVIPTQACQSLGQFLGGALVTPRELQANFGTTDPSQVTLNQLWSLPDPKKTARVIMDNTACLDTADTSAGHWDSTITDTGILGPQGGDYYANQCTADGLPHNYLQRDGIKKLVLAAARGRLTGPLSGQPNPLEAAKVGGLYVLDIQGTPSTDYLQDADCALTPHQLIDAEIKVLTALRGAWLAQPGVRQNLNVVAGDYTEYTDLFKDVIAMDERLGAGPGYEMAVQTSTGSLSSTGYDEHGDWAQGMMAGTSPAITGLPGGGYEMAYQTSNGHLWTNGTAGHTDWAHGTMAGTSPAIAALADGSYEVAYQDSNGHLLTFGSTGTSKDWGPGMKAGTSPAITALAGGGYEVAFQDSSGTLWTDGTAGNKAWGLGMKAGTSPAITFDGSGYEVAFQANTGNLWTVGTDNHWDWGLGMRAGTSPAITGLASGGYEVAFQANTGNLWTVGNSGNTDWGPADRMMAGTSPAIAALADGSYEVACQLSDGQLRSVGPNYQLDYPSLRTMPGVSPSITGIEW